MKLNLSDGADEEEEMLKRAIAMSLEQEEEEEPSSIKGELLKNINNTRTAMKTAKGGM